MFEEKCMEALASVHHSNTLKLAVIQNKSKEVFEALGGTEDIYYDIKGIVNRVATEILEEA